MTLPDAKSATAPMFTALNLWATSKGGVSNDCAMHNVAESKQIEKRLWQKANNGDQSHELFLPF